MVESVKALQSFKIDGEQGKMISEIMKMGLPKPEYGLATLTDLFVLELQNNRKQLNNLEGHARFQVPVIQQAR